MNSPDNAQAIEQKYQCSVTYTTITGQTRSTIITTHVYAEISCLT